MVATLLRVVGIDLKRLARETAITIMLAMLGAFAAMVALALGFVALYLWLELKLGTFAALGILGGYSFTARLAVSGSRVFCHSELGIERCLLASAWIRLASTANPSPPTRSAAIQASTTRSNTWRKMPLSRKRSLRARENAE